MDNDLEDAAVLVIESVRDLATALAREQIPPDKERAYIKAAKTQEEEGVLEFDDKPRVSWSSDGDSGAYVSAWVWVDDLDLEG